MSYKNQQGNITILKEREELFMKKKIVSMLLAACMVVSTLSMVACGKKETTQTGDAIEITVCDLVTSATGINRWKALRQQQFAKEHPEIKVNHVHALAGDTTNVVEYLTTVFMGDSAPVMYDVSSVYYMRDLYTAGLAADITPYLTEESSYYKMYDYVQKSVEYGESLVGYPAGMEIPFMGFYNEALVEAGYDPNNFSCETWDEYYEIVSKMNKTGRSGSSLYMYEYFLWPANWFASNGVEPAVQNEDGTITLNFTDSQLLETIDFFKKLYKAGYTNSNLTYTQISDMMTLIQNKKLSSFTFYPTWLDEFQAVGIEADEITVKPFPKGPSHTDDDPSSTVIVSGTVFNAQKSSEELQAAVTYFEYMNGEEAMKDLAQFKADNKIQDFTLSPYESVDWKAGIDTTYIPASWISETQELLRFCCCFVFC